MDKEKILGFLYDVRDELIPVEIAVKDLEKILNTQEHVTAQENLTLKCELYDAELKIEELNEELYQSHEAWERKRTAELYEEVKKGKFASTLREEFRQKSNKEAIDLEQRFSKETGMHKQIAADKINEVELLKADVRRLEKLLKVLEDPISTEFKRRPGDMRIGGVWLSDKHLSCEEQMKETDALRVEVMSKIKRDKEASDFFDNLYKERRVKTDPWVDLISVFNEDKFSSLPSVDVILSLDIEEGFDVKINRNFTVTHDFLEITFTSVEHGGSWTIPSKHIENMVDLKNIYNSFKEIYG